MSQTMTVARKELRAFFLSPVALIFLGAFLFAVLFSFFWVDTFFRRNIADVRPLFHWLPVWLIFLVGALTMRLWSEEQHRGTLEVLLTMPVRTSRLVLGKFVAGLALVGVALLLTLGLPITVSMLGQLDWGPVFGGYLGALLLAATYLAIGLCISASTNNPIVALILTWASCGLLYLVGSDLLVSFAGNRWTEILRALGTGSRFESIQRGVIDLRDLVYYGSLTVGFLLLNTAILEAKRWSQGARTRRRRTNTKTLVVLGLANLLVLNLVLSPVRAARLDLTERGEYSISQVTEKLLSELEAPLTIRGYFSEKTHPLLAPLVPRIRDLAREYGAVGGDKVIVEFVDPQANPAAEKEANESYGIKSVPFQFADRHQAAVVNSYFSLLIKYGDKHEVLGFEDLIEVKVTGMSDIEVKLRNMEYDLTRSIKKVVYGFTPLETVFARAPGKIELTGYLTPQSLPDNYKQLPERLEKLAAELKEQSGGKLTFATVDPGGEDKDKLRRELYEKYGIKPMAVSLFSEEYFYAQLILRAGEKVERIYPAPDASEAQLKEEIGAALKRLVPGFLKTVGLVTAKEAQPPQNPMMRQPPQQQDHYQLLQERLAETYAVRDVSLADGRVPGDIDVLALVGPEGLAEKERYAVDQFLMRGGAVVVLSGSHALDPMSQGSISVKKVDSGLGEVLAHYGVTIKPELVLDTQNSAFPVPVERNVMGMSVRELQLVDYPFFIDVRQGGMAEESPVLAGLPAVTVQFGSPIELTKKESLEAVTLLRSSPAAWVQQSLSVQPDFTKYPDKGFGVEGETKERVLAVSLRGTFTSAFADKPSPLLAGDRPAADKSAATEKASEADGRTIKKSPATARLAVVGSSDFVNDLVLNLSRQTGSEQHMNNLQLVQNLVDWSVADVDLLSIRSRGTFARTLEPMEEASQTTWETINYGLVIVALLAIFGLSVFRRRSVRPMQLVSTKPAAEQSK